MNINHVLTGTKRTRRAPALLFGLAVALLLLFGSHSVKVAHAATTFTVNSTGDEDDLDFPGGIFDGSSDDRCDVDAAAGRQCTLRAAIQAANILTGADTIRFRISGNGPHTITPATEFPQITRPVTIDGYTQGDNTTGNASDDATENTLTPPGETNAVLKIVLHGQSGENYCSGLNVAANNVVIRGLVINNFEFCGAANSSSAPGIRLSGTGHRVEGNFIGTDAAGTALDRNARGVSLIEANGSTIGGASPEDRNLISGNVRSGVEVSVSSRNTIRNNLIGPDKSGQPLAASNAVSGGVVISSGTGNRVLSNSIFSNGPLGIDLGGNGVTANDPGPPPDADTGPNRLQNFPVITSAQTFGSFTSIGGRLESTPSTRETERIFIIQFFSNPPINPPSTDLYEGKTFLGQTQVTTNRQGNATFNFAPFQEVPVGQVITATATRMETGDTSEFSAARRVEEPGIGP